MPWDSCIVYFNNANKSAMGTFYAGDVVAGSVILEFIKNIKLDYLNFKVLGICKAQWSRPMPTMPFIKIYSGKREILDTDIGATENFEGKSIGAGVRICDFRFTLPMDLPSSFKSSIAQVRYFVKIEGKSTYKFKKVKKVVLNVIARVGLNDEYYLIRTDYKCYKTFWNSKKVSMTIKTYRGFSVNQYVPFEINLTNESKVKISKIIVILFQKIRYNVPSGYADAEKEKCRVQFDKLFNTVVETCSFGMEIPEINPSTLCLQEPMVDISYVFRVNICFSFYSDLIKDIPVTIATLPMVHLNGE